MVAKSPRVIRVAAVVANPKANLLVVAQAEDKPKGNQGKQSNGVGPSKGKGIANSHGDKNAGKKDPKSGKGDGTKDGGWVTVTHKKVKSEEPWMLRSQDWNAPVVPFSEVTAKLRSADVFRAVVLCDEQQADTLGTMLNASEKAYGVRSVQLHQGDGAERCPGQIGSRLVFKQVKFSWVKSDGQLAPGLAAVSNKVPKMPTVETAVLYVNFFQRLMPKKMWDNVKANPQKVFHSWLSKKKLRAMESWSWIEEKMPDGTFSKIFGIARFVASDALKILKMSGDEIFCDPSRSFNMAPFHVEWIAQGDEEFAVDYLKRAMLYARIMV